MRSKAADRPPRPGRTTRNAPRAGAAEPRPSESRAVIVYKALQRILEGDVGSIKELLQLLQPCSGLEYLQMVEERSLSGQCGNPLCSAAAPDTRQLQSFIQTRNDEQPECTFCSASCELAARRVAGSLGDEKQALSRFTAQQLQPARKSSSMPDKNSERLSAGDTKNPVMLLKVHEREADCNGAMDFIGEKDWRSVEGFAPRLMPPGQDAVQSRNGAAFLGNGDSDRRGQSNQASLNTIEELSEDLQRACLEEDDEHASDGLQSESGDDDTQVMARERADSSDEDSQASDLDQFDDAQIPWMEEHSIDPLSGLGYFASIHHALEGLVTDSSVAFCLGKNAPPQGLLSEQQQQVFKALQMKLGQTLTPVFLSQLDVKLPVPQVGSRLLQLLRRLNLTGPVPSLKSKAWEVICAAMLMALSLHVYPEIQIEIESREAQEALGRFCQRRDLEMDHLIGLCELLVEQG